jgi:myo-inositol-1(or 4)-monophosphatase
VDVGVIYAPALGEMFVAERGEGASLNGRRLQVSPQTDLGRSLVATGFAYRRNELRVTNLENFSRLALEVRGIRRCGAAALDLAYVAAGRYEAFWELYLKPWDVAAGMLLVSEAGGRVTAIVEGHDPLEGVEVLASNGIVHEEVRRRLMPPDPAWVTIERERLFGRD